MRALLLLLLLVPVAAGATGPYAGILREGERATHAYDNTLPEDAPCPDYFAPIWWVVQLRYAPPTAALALGVEGRGASEGSLGHATVAFEGGGCEAFTITVDAFQAAVPVAYEVDVGTTLAPPR